MRPGLAKDGVVIAELRRVLRSPAFFVFHLVATIDGSFARGAKAREDVIARTIVAHVAPVTPVAFVRRGKEPAAFAHGVFRARTAGIIGGAIEVLDAMLARGGAVGRGGLPRAVAARGHALRRSKLARLARLALRLASRALELTRQASRASGRPLGCGIGPGSAVRAASGRRVRCEPARRAGTAHPLASGSLR